MNAKTLFLILLLFTLLNVVPWLIFLSGRRVALGPLVQKQSLNGRSNALRVEAEERGSNEKHTLVRSGEDETADEESARTRVIIPHVVLDRQSSLRTVRQIAELGSHAFYTIVDPHPPPSSPISHDATTVGGYEIRRSASRACAVLPTNVTIDWEEDYLIGTEKEIISWNALQRYTAMQETTQKQSPAPGMREDSNSTDDDTAGGGAQKNPVPTLGNAKPPIAHVAEFAYVLMVSNHKYVDGALVCADSIRSHSKLVQSGEADVVLIVTGKIKSQLWELLASVFDRVLIVRSMDVHAPMSYYKTTFDKMYLYSLTEYSSVVFFDADSLLVSNPDSLFRQVSDQHSLTAVGGGDYFQTGLLIIKPSMHLFLDLYLEYRYGPFHYNQWRARDGILFRLCLMESHDNIPHPPSVYHFYGFIKPWFNKDVPHPSSKDPLLLDGRYQEWWERYEALHEKYFAAITQRDLRYDDTVKSYGYGGTSLSSKASKKKQFIPFPFRTIDEARALVNPRQYMWLQRFSGGSEYLRPTQRHLLALMRENATLRDAWDPLPSGTTGAGGDGRKRSTEIVLGNLGVNCVETCAATVTHATCVEVLLTHPKINDCRFGNGLLQTPQMNRSVVGDVDKEDDETDRSPDAPKPFGEVPGVRCDVCRPGVISSQAATSAPYFRQLSEMDLKKQRPKKNSKKPLLTGKVECVYHYFIDSRIVPSCEAAPPSNSRRICPCR